MANLTIIDTIKFVLMADTLTAKTSIDGSSIWQTVLEICKILVPALMVLVVCQLDIVV